MSPITSDALFAASPADAAGLVLISRMGFDDWAEQFCAQLSAGAHEYAWHVFNGTEPATLPAKLDGIVARCANATANVQLHGRASAMREMIRAGGLWLLGELQ